MSELPFSDELLDFTDDNELVDKRVKPALLALLHDQAELLNSDTEPDLRGGFDSRRELIGWYQRASVRTLGHISETWKPRDCIADSALVNGATSSGKFTGGRGQWYRRVLESTHVQPAFSEAYEEMRDVAKEYVQRPEEGDRSSPGKDLDPSSQAYLAMRPGFQVLDKQQQRALSDLWGGFESVEAVQDWIHALNAPTNGEIDSSLASLIVSDETAMERLVYDADADRSRRYREALAATVVLPAFVDGVRSIDADELAQETSGTPTTMRMKGGS